MQYLTSIIVKLRFQLFYYLFRSYFISFIQRIFLYIWLLIVSVYPH